MIIFNKCIQFVLAYMYKYIILIIYLIPVNLINLSFLINSANQWQQNIIYYNFAVGKKVKFRSK